MVDGIINGLKKHIRDILALSRELRQDKFFGMHISPLPQCVTLVQFRTPKLHSRRKNNCVCGACGIPVPTSFIPCLRHLVS